VMEAWNASGESNLAHEFVEEEAEAMEGIL
jgi:hypothetical protein